MRAGKQPNPEGITASERDILQKLADGYKVVEVARSRTTSHRTTEFTLHLLRRKFGVRTTTALVASALRKKFII